MLNPPALAPAVTAARPRATPFVGLTYRSIHLRHFANFATARPLYVAAGGVAGSRFVLPHGPASLYSAFESDTADREGNQVFYQAAHSPAGPALLRAGGLRPDPVVLIGIHVQVARLLDLRAPTLRQQLNIQMDAELIGPWLGVPNAPTQVLGGAVFDDTFFEGLIYTSAQNPGGHCLVIFPDRLQAGSRLHFHDAATGLVAQLP